MVIKFNKANGLLKNIYKDNIFSNLKFKLRWLIILIYSHFMDNIIIYFDQLHLPS